MIVRLALRCVALVGDLARVAVVAAAAVCAVIGQWDDVARFVIVFGVLLVSRLARLPWADVVIHGTTTGAVALVVTVAIGPGTATAAVAVRGAGGGRAGRCRRVQHRGAVGVGALIFPAFLGAISSTGWVFAVLAIFIARPVALWISFGRSGLDMREQAAAMWFGPKGFASVVYGLLVSCGAACHLAAVPDGSRPPVNGTAAVV